MKRRPVALASIKAVHTLAWLSIESSIVYLLYAGLRRQSDQRAAVAGAVVTVESLIFAANLPPSMCRYSSSRWACT